MKRLGKQQVGSLYAFSYFVIGMVTLVIPPAQAQIAGGQAAAQQRVLTAPSPQFRKACPAKALPPSAHKKPRRPHQAARQLNTNTAPQNAPASVTYRLQSVHPTPSTQQRQAAAPVLIHHLAEKSQQWLKQWGQAEIALQGSRLDRLQGGVALLLPLQQSPQQLLFTQGGWHRDSEGSLFTLGLGQRCFDSAHHYWGYHLFVDYQPRGRHQRFSLGLAQRSHTLLWHLNGYLPLTPRRLVANRADWVRPARGLDLRLQYQPPQRPHWRLNLSSERYWGTIARPQGGTLLRHPTAMTLGFAYTPLPLVTADYGFKVGSGRRRSHQLQLTLRYRLGVPLAHQLDPQQVAIAQSLEGDRLALVQRNVRMVLQQQPNDEIQLALQPERISQPVGSRVTIALQLRSARPLEEWRLEWRGDLLQHTAPPQLNDTRDQAHLILPTLPGTYRLQLVARNARGVVAYSNELWVIADSVAVPVPQHSTGTQTAPTVSSARPVNTVISTSPVFIEGKAQETAIKPIVSSVPSSNAGKSTPSIVEIEEESQTDESDHSYPPVNHQLSSEVKRTKAVENSSNNSPISNDTTDHLIVRRVQNGRQENDIQPVGFIMKGEKNLHISELQRDLNTAQTSIGSSSSISSRKEPENQSHNSSSVFASSKQDDLSPESKNTSQPHTSETQYFDISTPPTQTTNLSFSPSSTALPADSGVMGEQSSQQVVHTTTPVLSGPKAKARVGGKIPKNAEIAHKQATPATTGSSSSALGVNESDDDWVTDDEQVTEIARRKAHKNSYGKAQSIPIDAPSLIVNNRMDNRISETEEQEQNENELEMKKIKNKFINELVLYFKKVKQKNPDTDVKQENPDTVKKIIDLQTIVGALNPNNKHVDMAKNMLDDLKKQEPNWGH
jgi:Inverse autotransporter, beta-domain